jgi:hypothetical protein
LKYPKARATSYGGAQRNWLQNEIVTFFKGAPWASAGAAEPSTPATAPTPCSTERRETSGLAKSLLRMPDFGTSADSSSQQPIADLLIWAEPSHRTRRVNERIIILPASSE